MNKSQPINSTYFKKQVEVTQINILYNDSNFYNSKMRHHFVNVLEIRSSSNCFIEHPNSYIKYSLIKNSNRIKYKFF